MMSLQRLLWPAGGIAVAVSFANTTVYAAEEKAKMQTLYKPSELPLYGDPEPAMFELIESEGTRYTHAVSSVRKQTWDFLESIQGQIDNVTHKWSVAKAHTNESLTYIQEDAGLLPRTALITVAGLGGIVAGYRGGIMRKLFYGTVGTLAGASLCYPNEAVAIGRMGWHFTIDQAEQALGRNIPGLSYKEEESVKVETAESSQPGSDNKKATKAAAVSKTSASLVDMGMSREEDNDMYTEHARK